MKVYSVEIVLKSSNLEGDTAIDGHVFLHASPLAGGELGHTRVVSVVHEVV
jgi:hypothetical protein